MRERDDSRYDQFEISPETIDQELRTVVIYLLQAFNGVYTTATSFCHMTLARVDNAPGRKPDEFSLDLSEMRPVNVVTSLMCHLKRPLRYGGYLGNQIQQNNFEMC